MKFHFNFLKVIIEDLKNINFDDCYATIKSNPATVAMENEQFFQKILFINVAVTKGYNLSLSMAKKGLNLQCLISKQAHHIWMGK